MSPILDQAIPVVHRERPAEVEFAWQYAGVQRSLYSYILSLIPNVADADDVMQETAAILWERMADYDPTQPFLNWSMTFAKFQAMKYRKYSARHRARTVALTDAAFLAVANQDEFDWVSENHLQQALTGCVSQLGVKDQQLLRYRYSKEHSVHEMAGDDQRVAARLYKRLRRIRELVGECIRRKLGSSTP